MNRTTYRTIKILELVSKYKDGLYLKDIVELMDIPKSSAFDIVHTLVRIKMLDVKEQDNKRYIIGVKAFEIGNAFLDDSDIISKARVDLEALAEEMNKTVFIGILDSDKIVYIYKYQPESARITTSKVGTRNDVYNTSLGKSLVAHLNESKKLEIVDRLDFIKRTEYTITRKDDLLKDLDEVRERGYAIDFRENENHMVCIGAPIFDYKGEVIASISVSDLHDEYRDLKEEGRRVKEVAQKISRSLGYHN